MNAIKCVAIDDDPLFLEIMKFYCKKIKGVDMVATFENPIEGALGVVKLKPDLLFLDIEMPYLDGFETMSMLESQPKIVVISSHQNYDLSEIDLNIAEFVTKPLEGVEQLEKIIQKVINS